jgi:hypothetical protein
VMPLPQGGAGGPPQGAPGGEGGVEGAGTEEAQSDSSAEGETS